MDRVKIVDFYLEKIKLNQLDLYDARKEMEKNNVEEEEIKTIIRILDNELQKRMILEHENRTAKNIIAIGVVLTSIGAIFTIGTFTGIIPMGDNSFLLAYGPFLGGLSILFGGLAKRRK